ncbi:DNA adenine methylase [Christensenellaceae bacterium OttesenSCG-928-M15]|nr:DNA adenine methylase [Christensenellaceae bacterium OttesenSCG-928-M15]
MDSFISWIGGKKLLRDQIIERFPAQIGRYIEVFGGAGWVLFRKEKHAAMEVYNDINGELVNLFRCAKHHPEALQLELDLCLNSREIFYDYRAQQDMQGLTDIQRAARFFYLIRCSYGSEQKSFACSKQALPSAIKRINDIHTRLATVIIENRDFEHLIHTYDRPDTLFFCDPPYFEAEGYYTGFSREDHERLKEILKGIKGKFILTYNDHSYIRELYKDFHIEEIERAHNLTTRYNAGKYKELIIRNAG